MAYTRKQLEALDKFPTMPRDGRFPEHMPVLVRGNRDNYAVWANSHAAILQAYGADNPLLPKDPVYDMLSINPDRLEKSKDVLIKTVLRTEEQTSDVEPAYGDVEDALLKARKNGMVLYRNRYPNCRTYLQINTVVDNKMDARIYNMAYVKLFSEATRTTDFLFYQDRRKRSLVLTPVINGKVGKGAYLFMLETLTDNPKSHWYAEPAWYPAFPE